MLALRQLFSKGLYHQHKVNFHHLLKLLNLDHTKTDHLYLYHQYLFLKYLGYLIVVSNCFPHLKIYIIHVNYNRKQNKEHKLLQDCQELQQLKGDIFHLKQHHYLLRSNLNHHQLFFKYLNLHLIV